MIPKNFTTHGYASYSGTISKDEAIRLSDAFEKEMAHRVATGYTDLPPPPGQPNSEIDNFVARLSCDCEELDGLVNALFQRLNPVLIPFPASATEAIKQEAGSSLGLCLESVAHRVERQMARIRELLAGLAI